MEWFPWLFFVVMSGKTENLLTVSMNVSSEERSKSRQLSAGYEEDDSTWEFVIKYSGKEESLEQYFGHPFVFLYHQYAISRGTKEEIESLAAYPGTIWIEKPKAMEYALTEGRLASCVNPVTPPQGNLTGRGVLLAVIDSGLDIFHPDFRKEDGRTRILGLWNQTGEGTPPERYRGGAYYGEEQINEALVAGRREGGRLVQAEDLSGHGTHVAGIAAGNGRASEGRNRGIATEADLLVVKLGVPSDSDFPRTTQVMTGIDFAVRFALERNLPLVINLSFGNNYGAHDGSTLLETYMNEITGMGKITIVTGMGNQGNGRRHTSGNIKLVNEKSFIAGNGEQGFGLQIWKNYVDTFAVSIISPSGEESGPISYGSEITRVNLGNTQIVVYYGEPVPYSVNQEIYLSFLPIYDQVTPGVWKIRLLPDTILDGNYEMWLPDDGILSSATGFLRPLPEDTLTIPSTAEKVISVGAYDSLTNQIAPFSGRGDERLPFLKPDLVAPGVNIESCAPGGGYTIKSGTSMAAPFVSGSAALLMQYGIIEGRDPYLYGEKVKAYLRKGAEKLPGFDVYPNSVTGYGSLCLEKSFPEEP